MQFHDVANIFPLMDGDEYQSLVADIAEHGQREPIYLHDGKIIDGRNRYRACCDLGLVPEYRTWNGDGSLVAFVISLNLKRRHLSSSQRAVVALDALPFFEAEARERQIALAGTRPNNGSDLSQIFDQGNGRATEQAAAVASTNRQYVSDAKKLSDEAPALIEAIRTGKMTIPQAKREHIMRVMGSSESPEWYTPRHILNAVLELFGEIDLDPCSNSHYMPNVPANRRYTKEDDGLSKSWRSDTLYMNPPYGTEIGKWTAKLIASYEQGDISEALALIPGRIDTDWYEPLYAYTFCHIHGRLVFENSPYSAPFPSVVVYLGTRADDFARVFSSIGPIVRRIA